MKVEKFAPLCCPGVACAAPYVEETWDLLERHMWDETQGLYAEEADEHWVVDPYRSESGNLHTRDAGRRVRGGFAVALRPWESFS